MSKVNFNGFPYVLENTARRDEKCGNFMYITIAVNGTNRNNTFWKMKAPVTQVTIKEAVDYSVTKSLKSDVLVATFGDQPVSIKIAGAVILNPAPDKDNNIARFYAKNKFSASRTTRFDLGLAWAGQAASYRCILIGMDLEGSSDRLNAAAMSTYALDFIGVSKYQSGKSLAGV